MESQLSPNSQGQIATPETFSREEVRQPAPIASLPSFRKPRRHAPDIKQVVRATAIISRFDLTSDAGARGYLQSLVDALAAPVLKGEIVATNDAAMVALLTLGVLGMNDKQAAN